MSFDPQVEIYTDGAASPNPGPGGYGVVLMRDGQRQELSGGFRITTNNRMELFSVITALKALGTGKCVVTIYSDSRYVVDMFNGGYAAQWRKNGWTRNKGKDPALNSDLWNDLLNVSAVHAVQFVWIRGHADNRENARCDELAVAARQVADLPADEGYEQPPAPRPSQQLSLFHSFN